jgi:hypothetical protein
MSFHFVILVLSLSFVVVHSSIHVEEHHICGSTWHIRYADLHRSIVSGESHPKYLISVPVEAGLADIMFGYVTGFIWSLLTDRAFLILHDEHLEGCEQRTIEFAYNSHHIDWKAPHIEQSVYNCLSPPYNNPLPCDKSETFMLGQKSLTFGHVHAINSIISQFRQGNLSNILGDKDVIFLTSNRGMTYHLFDHPLYKDKLTEMGFKRETLFSCIFQYLFKINSDVCVHGCENTRRALLTAGADGANTVRIGIQVRNQHATSAPQHFNCVDGLLKFYSAQGKKVLLLLITASTALQQSMKELYKDQLLLATGDPQGVVEVHDRPPATSLNDCSKTVESDRQAMLDSARDVYLMSLTDIQIVSKDSGFGIFGGMSRPHSHPIVYKIGDDQRQCEDLPQGDDLSVFADYWSGF